MTERRPKRLDDVDRRLMERLAEDPRTSQRALAEDVGVTDETVAARLRRLRDDNVIATTAVIDWRAAGYRAEAIARLKISRGSAEELARPISRVDGFHFLASSTGCCDLVLALLGTDFPALRASIAKIARIRNVSILNVDVVTTSLVYKVDALTLPVRPWLAEELPNPNPPLDDLDRALIHELTVDGHESSRELARRLKVSDGTLRGRIRRLEEGGLLKLIAGRDPVATGEMHTYAMIFIGLDGTGSTEALLRHRAVLSAHESIGRADLIMNAGAPSESMLDAFLTRDLRRTPGIRDVEVAHLVEVLEHRTHLVRFV